jgi:diguanylate cyclase (GGDEF)-like protein
LFLLLLSSLPASASPRLGAEPAPSEATSAPPALPDHPHYAIEHFGDQYGLSAITVTSMAQDTTGFLWIGTLTGLYRYDGFSVTHFGAAEGLPSNQVYQLIVTPGGALYVRTRRGIARLEGQRFHCISVPSESGGLSDIRESFVVDAAGNLFAATERGLLRVDGRDHSYKLYGTIEGLPAAGIEALALGPDDTVWFATQRHLGRFTRGSRRPELLARPELPREEVRWLIVDGEEKLWVRGEKNLGTVDLTKPAPWTIVTTGEKLPVANLYGGPSLDQQGRLMLPTIEGLYRRKAGKWLLVNRSNGLSGSAVFSAFADREGTIWIGLAGAGLDRWPGSNQWTGWSDSDGLSDSLVLSILRDTHGRLWLGTNTALAMWAPNAHRWKTWDSSAGAPRLGVSQLEMTSDGWLWAASGGRVYRMNTLATEPRPEPVQLAEDMLPVPTISAANGNRVWLGGENSLHELRVSGGKFELVNIAVPEESTRSVALVSASPDGVLWTGGRGGLSRYDGTHWLHFNEKDGLLADTARNVQAVSDTEVWIGYPDEGRVTRARLDASGKLTVEHFAKGVCALGKDHRGNVWLEMEQSLGMLSPGGTLRTFTRDDGLIWDDVNCEGFWEESDGSILIGTSHGLARYDPARKGLAAVAPKVLLTQAEFAGHDHLAEAGAVIPFEERTFTARFAALTFRHPQQARCRYRLRGLESGFTVTPMREAKYPLLPPGKYVFEVTCGSAELGWSAVPATYSFEVLSPWWRRWWAETGAALLFLFGALVVIRYRTRRLESERKRLEAAVEERSAELAQANRDLEEASLTDPLTGLRNRRFFHAMIPADAEQALRAYQSENRAFSRDHRDLIFYLIDIDRFKDVNDRYGHDTGDQLLEEIARRLRRIVRQSDFLIRWGGEEFLVVCRSAERQGGVRFGERLLAEMAAEPFVLRDGKSLEVTCSVGWAPYPWMSSAGAPATIDDVIKLADRGLYRAKHSGRNRAVGIVPGEAETPPDPSAGLPQNRVENDRVQEITTPIRRR